MTANQLPVCAYIGARELGQEKGEGQWPLGWKRVPEQPEGQSVLTHAHSGGLTAWLAHRSPTTEE